MLMACSKVLAIMENAILSSRKHVSARSWSYLLQLVIGWAVENWWIGQVLDGLQLELCYELPQRIRLIRVVQTNALTAELGAGNIALYALAYTPLKQLHFINTWVGAVVGAIPPLMGWAAASGRIDPGGWVLASGLYFWQLPHFMALAYFCRHDYAAGGYKMLSLVDASGRRTASCALRNCLYLSPLGFVAQHLGVTSGYFGWENLLLTSGIGATAALFYLRPNPDTARRLFRTSLVYLPFFMSAMVVHRIPRSTSSIEAIQSFEQARIPVSEGEVEEDEKERLMVPSELRTKDMHRPPIAFISYAPFPFLPAPDY